MKKIFAMLFSLIVLQSFAVASEKFDMPKGAKQIAPGLYYLGKAITPQGRVVDEMMYLHFAKPSKPAKPGKTPTCYKLTGKGYVWKDIPQDVYVNPSLPPEYFQRHPYAHVLNASYVLSANRLAAEEWDAWTGSDIFGSAIQDLSAEWVMDGKNDLVFGDYDQDGVIAVTWFRRSSLPPPLSEMLEFNVLYDIDFEWGDATMDSSLMDLQNIATHELGHGWGLSDLYEDACMDETMYGYSGEGETSKIDLNAGDIDGIRKLYG